MDGFEKFISSLEVSGFVGFIIALISMAVLLLSGAVWRSTRRKKEGPAANP
jgi:hypothetical protein